MLRHECEERFRRLDSLRSQAFVSITATHQHALQREAVEMQAMVGQLDALRVAMDEANRQLREAVDAVDPCRRAGGNNRSPWLVRRMRPEPTEAENRSILRLQRTWRGRRQRLALDAKYCPA